MHLDKYNYTNVPINWSCCNGFDVAKIWKLRKERQIIKCVQAHIMQHVNWLEVCWHKDQFSWVLLWWLDEQDYIVIPISEDISLLKLAYNGNLHSKDNWLNEKFRDTMAAITSQDEREIKKMWYTCKAIKHSQQLIKDRETRQNVISSNIGSPEVLNLRTYPALPEGQVYIRLNEK